MPFVTGTFIGVLGLVVAVYWLMFERQEAQGQSRLRKRLRGAAGPKAGKRIGLVKEAEKLSAVRPLDLALARTSRIAGRVQQLLARADVRLSVGGLVLASACLFAAAWLVIGGITHLTWLGFGVGCLLALVPYWVIRFKATRRMRTFEE